MALNGHFSVQILERTAGAHNQARRLRRRRLRGARSASGPPPRRRRCAAKGSAGLGRPGCWSRPEIWDGTRKNALKCWSRPQKWDGTRINILQRSCLPLPVRGGGRGRQGVRRRCGYVGVRGREGRIDGTGGRICLTVKYQV